VGFRESTFLVEFDRIVHRGHSCRSFSASVLALDFNMNRFFSLIRIVFTDLGGPALPSRAAREHPR
jgi:hypothetical protein